MKSNLENTIILKNTDKVLKKEVFEDQELNKLLKFKLNKAYFTEEDLLQINDIILNGRKINGDINIINFDNLDLIPNLKKIEIKNINISKEQMKTLQNLKEISFRNCKIESIENIRNVTKLTINNSKIGDFEQINQFKNIVELDLINIKIENFDFLKALSNLQVLRIKNVEKFLLEKINFPLPIKYLSIEGVEHIDKELLQNFDNLEVLSIDREKEEEWAEQLEKIMQQGIKILLNDIYEY